MHKSLPRLTVAFVVWPGFYAIVNTFVFGAYTGMRALITQFGIGYYHLWFLWALMWLYIVTPILRRIVAERSVALGFTALALVFPTVLPLTYGIPVVGRVISSVVGTARVDLVLGYSLFFGLGHLLHQGLLPQLRIPVLILGIVVSGVVTALGSSLVSGSTGVPDTVLYANLATSGGQAQSRQLGHRGRVVRDLPCASVLPIVAPQPGDIHDHVSREFRRSGVRCGDVRPEADRGGCAASDP